MVAFSGDRSLQKRNKLSIVLKQLHFNSAIIDWHKGKHFTIKNNVLLEFPVGVDRISGCWCEVNLQYCA
jgi:hypothetical protein